MFRIIAVFAVLLFAHQASAQTKFFQCKDQWGQPIFSQRPCGSNSEEKSVTAHDHISGTGGETSAPSDGAPGSLAPAVAAPQTFSMEVTRDKRRLSEIKIDKKRRERKIQQFAEERDEKIAELQYKAQHAANNLAGATWLDSLASEMSAVATQYETKINQQQEKIDDLNEESDEIKARLAAD